MAIADKLALLAQTKADIKDAIIEQGQELADEPFSEYAEKILAIEVGGGGAPDELLILGGMANVESGYKSGGWQVSTTPISFPKIQISPRAGEGAVVTKVPYDLTDYNYIKTLTSVRDTLTLDISSISGERYIRVIAYGEGRDNNYSALAVGTNKNDPHNVYDAIITEPLAYNMIDIYSLTLTKEAPD